MEEGLRETGIPPLGKVPWGTHLCQFYKSPNDLADILVPYFKTGLEQNELCVWITSGRPGSNAAARAMKRAVPLFEDCAAKGQIEIVAYDQWYLKGGVFSSRKVIESWVDKLKTARARGYAGLRAAGDTAWIEKKDWGNFRDYETELSNAIGRYRMIVLCAYSLGRCGASEAVDVVNSHQGALVKRGRQWILMESSERRKCAEIVRRDTQTLEGIIAEKTRQLMKVELELEKARRLSDIGTLAATVAHELRNPLAAIGMAVANIRRKVRDPFLDRHLGNIETKIVESDQIINNLLFYSRIRVPQYKNVDLHGLLEDCVNHTAVRHSSKSVSFSKDIAVLKGLSIEADPFQLQEVFTNILNNSYDALPDSRGRIRICAEAGGGEVRISFTDNGCGIRAEDLSRVFEPFFSTKAKGTGLGLAVCRQIVALHNGLIALESEPGKGTTVTVTFPGKNNDR